MGGTMVCKYKKGAESKRCIMRSFECCSGLSNSVDCFISWYIKC